jgi:hypothetical protein
MLIFDLIELGEPSLAGRFWASSDDWAILVNTTEDQSARRLVRQIETFRRVGEFATETALFYGAKCLPPRRQAFFATRID